jgi:hypothetical protein
MYKTQSQSEFNPTEKITNDLELETQARGSTDTSEDPELSGSLSIYENAENPPLYAGGSRDERNNNLEILPPRNRGQEEIGHSAEIENTVHTYQRYDTENTTGTLNLERVENNNPDIQEWEVRRTYSSENPSESDLMYQTEDDDTIVIAAKSMTIEEETLVNKRNDNNE